MIVNKYNKGNGGGGTDYTAGQYIQIAEDVISVTGITPDLYLTTADTQDFATEADITAATQGLATEAYVTAATQGFITSAYTGFTKTEDFDELVENLEGKEEVVASALTQLENSVLEISGSTPDLSNYYTKAETDAEITGATQGLATEAYVTAATQGFATQAYVTAATSPIQTQLDDIERVTATAYTELHDAILEISGSTPDLSNYYTKAETDAEITGATQGFITSAYTGFTKTEDFDDLVDMVETKEEVVASAITELHNEILDISGDTPDMSNYYTSAQTEEAISAATSGKADKQNVTARTVGNFLPRWNSQGVITGDYQYFQRGITLNGGTNQTFFGTGPATLSFYAPTSAGTAGDILVSTGNGAPVWTTDNKVSSTSVSTIWKGTQAEYDAITTKDPNTFYIIVETQG